MEIRKCPKEIQMATIGAFRGSRYVLRGIVVMCVSYTRRVVFALWVL